MEYSIGLLHRVLLDYFWTTFGPLLDHFWITHLSLVLMIVAWFFSMEYFWTTFGLLLDHFWSTHPSLVLMTVASFLLLRAHVASHASPYNELLYCTVVSDVKCINFIPL